MTDFQAALGLSQLKKLNKFILARRQLTRWYRQYLGVEKNIILPLEAADCRSSWHLYVIRTKNKADRPRLRQYLLKNGIGVNFHYPAVYAQPYYRNHGYGGLKLPVEEIYQSSCVTLPCFPGLEFPKVKFVCDKIKSFYGRKNS